MEAYELYCQTQHIINQITSDFAGIRKGHKKNLGNNHAHVCNELKTAIQTQLKRTI